MFFGIGKVDVSQGEPTVVEAVMSGYFLVISPTCGCQERQHRKEGIERAAVFLLSTSLYLPLRDAVKCETGACTSRLECVNKLASSYSEVRYS